MTLEASRKIPLKRISRELSLSDKVEESLREAIIKNVYAVNDRLPPETELVEVFGVSRTVVREAIRMLAGQGLVEIRGRQGVFVSKIDMSQILAPFASLIMQKCGNKTLPYVSQVRYSIEPDIARMAALNRSEADLEYMRVNHADMIKNKDVPEELIKVDVNFHNKLAFASGNPIVPIIMEPVLALLPRFISENFKIFRDPFIAINQHEKIITCIENRDSEGAYQTMLEHMKTAQKHIKMSIENIDDVEIKVLVDSVAS